MTEGKVAEVTLQVVAADMAVGGHDKQRLGVGPAQALDRALVPRYAAELLPSEAVYIYRRLGRLARLMGLKLGLIRPKGWRAAVSSVARRSSFSHK